MTRDQKKDNGSTTYQKQQDTMKAVSKKVGYSCKCTHKKN